MSREKAQALLCENFGPFGKLLFPYHKMGKIDSLDLFGYTELMILAMYWHNKERWKNVLDIGANIGLHTLCMTRMGFRVKAYEPDPDSFWHLSKNVSINCDAPGSAELYPSAVHTSNSRAEFVRVLDNLTGNHLAGYKHSYGPRESMWVQTVDCRPLFAWADFAKIDSEGNEAELVETMTVDLFPRLEAVLEVRNTENARRIYEHLSNLEVPMYAQKVDWRRVTNFGDMPKANRDGSLFVGGRGPFV